MEPGVGPSSAASVRGQDFFPSLLGRTLAAEVLGFAGDRILLRLDGLTLSGRSRIPLEKGQVIQVRVEAGPEGTFVLRVLTDKPARVSGAEPGAGTPARAPRESPAALPDQAAAQSRLLFQIPLPVNGQVAMLKVAVTRRKDEERVAAEEGRRGKGRSRRSAPVSTTLRLDLPRLGPLAVDLILDGRRISVGLFARDAGALRALEEGRERLEAGLRQEGFAIQALRFLPLPERESADGCGDGPPAGGLDLLV